MKIEMRRKGRIRLLNSLGDEISQHNQVEEAVESATGDFTDNGYQDETYQILYPDRQMRILRSVVIAPAVDAIPPSPPTGLTLSTQAVPIQTTLNWIAPPEPDTASYIIYRSETGPNSGFTQIGTALVASYLDTTPLEAVQYWYKVSALDTTGNESQQSEAATTTTGVYAVYPLASESIFRNDVNTIVNQNATWAVTSQVALDGTFSFADGGSFKYVKGSQTGAASFSYIVYDYDGLGSDILGSWIHTVL